MARAASMGAMLLLIGTYAQTQSRHEHEQSLRKLLPGVWEQTLHEGIGKTEFHADGTFVYNLHYRLRGGHTATFITGHWEIRGNQLRMRNEDWSPRSYRYPNGTTKEIAVEPWTILTVTVGDADHIRLNDRIAVRITAIGRNRGTRWP